MSGSPQTVRVAGPPPLGALDVERFWRDGVIVVRGAFAQADADSWAEERDRLAALGAHHARTDAIVPHRRSATGGESPDRVEPVRPLSPVFRDLEDDPRLAGLVCCVAREPVVFFKDKLIIKPPGVGGYGLHQDWPYWEEAGVPPDATISAAVAIDSAPSASGPIEFFVGLHRERLPAPAGESRDVADSAIAGHPSSFAQVEAGDVIVFHALAPHRSAANSSRQTRSLLIVTYSLARHGDRASFFHG